MSGASIELFSDYFAQADNALSRIDARVKLAFTAAMLVLVLISSDLVILLTVAALSLASLAAVGIPRKMLLVRMAGPLVMIGVIILLQGVLFGETPLYSVTIAGAGVSLYQEGMLKGVLIAGRVLAGTALMLFLSMTTPVNALLGALKWFKVPDGWLELMTFTYRYIFVFVEEAQGIMDAQRLRLGYRRLGPALRSWGALMGSLFTRVYDQANATHSAMLLRGYAGTIYLQKPAGLTARDRLAGLAFASIVLIVALTMLYRAFHTFHGG